jgi:hypothetical protein
MMFSMYKFPVFLLFLLSALSCKKSSDQLPDPAQEATLSRSLVFPNQGNLEKGAWYGGVSVMNNRAFEENGLLYVFLDANGLDKTGDAILLGIDASNLQTGALKTYRFGGSMDLIRHGRYTFSNTRPNGSTWGSITDSKFGVLFEGELVITAYDATRRLLSGHFSVTVSDLINDPTKESIGGPVDPNNFCILRVEGQFRHLKIQ